VGSGTLLKRRVLLAMAVLAGAGIVAGFIPWKVRSNPWREAAVDRLKLALDARSLTFADMHFSALPWPRLTIDNLAMEQHGGGLKARADAAQVDLGFSSLLRGKPKPVGLVLAGVDLEVRAGQQEDAIFRNAGRILARVGDALSGGTPLNGLGKIALEQARITVRLPNGQVDGIDNARLNYTASSGFSRLAFSLAGMRNGADLRFDYHGAMPRPGQDSQPEALAFRLWSPGLSFEFDGKGSLYGRPAFSGNLIAKTGTQGPSPFAGMLAGLGIGALPPLEGSGQIEGTERGVSVSDLKLQIGADRFDGVGAVRHDGQRWHLSGTLAAGTADWTQAFRSLARLRGGDGSWNNFRFDPEMLFATSMDLRISADTLVVEGQKLRKLGVTVSTRPQRAELTLADAGGDRSQGRLRLLATPGREGIDLKVNGNLERVDIGQAVAQVTRVQRFSGQGNANLTLDTSGRSVAEFVSNADGKLNVAIREGELMGIDLIRLTTRRASRPERTLIEALGGKTPFDSATLTAEIRRGNAQPVDGYMQRGGLVGSVNGTVDFAQGVSDLNGSVVQLPLENFQTEPRPVLDFTITGPISEPRIVPNVSALLRRS